MTHPLVSIGVPIYKAERYIERCVRSLLEQTYDNLEYVFVDDCTPDASIDILKRVVLDYPERASQICIIYHDHNQGNAMTRNTVVEHCRGKFIAHVDADDWMEQNAVELLMSRQMVTGADIVSGRHIVHYSGGEAKERGSGQGLDKSALLPLLLSHKVTSVLWGRLIRRKLYTDHAIAADERGSFSEDFQVLPRLVWYANNIASIEDIVYHYNRENDYSLTTSLPTKLELQQQYLWTHKYLSVFFDDKDDNCRCISDETFVRYGWMWMQNWVQAHKKVNFDVLCQAIKAEEYRYCWHVIGWNNRLRRLIFSHYWLCRLFQLIRSKQG